MGEIKTLMVNELKGVRKDLNEIRLEVQKVDDKVHEVEAKMKELEKQVKLTKEENKHLGLKYEIRMKELQLRIRGV